MHEIDENSAENTINEAIKKHSAEDNGLILVKRESIAPYLYEAYYKAKLPEDVAVATIKEISSLHSKGITLDNVISGVVNSEVAAVFSIKARIKIV